MPATTPPPRVLGVPIYWLNGAKVADDYADFYDGSWDSNAARNDAGKLVFPELSPYLDRLQQ